MEKRRRTPWQKRLVCIMMVLLLTGPIFVPYLDAFASIEHPAVHIMEFFGRVPVRSPFQAAPDDEFERLLNEQGFPESYKEPLRQLHATYPNWRFQAQNTGMDWNDVVSNQYVLGKNLVASGSISSWKSIQAGAYDWNNSKWVGFDGSGWVAASKEIIEYYLDPRNFLNETSVFQFLVHGYNSSTQTTEGLQSMLQNTFMAGGTGGEEDVAYSTILMEAANHSGVNPYVLAAMILQEQGSSGSGKSISGAESGYGGYYNYFNIEAYAGGGMTAIQRGLWYASQSGNYQRPWSSRRISIIGGSEHYGSNYVKAGQDTFYLKKFNVQGANPHKHQYMTNVQGAAGEAAKLAQAYNAQTKAQPLEFRIPVYQNMPGSKVSIPTGDGNPNNMLKSLSVDNHSLTPSFDKDVVNYNLIVSNSVNSITVNAASLHSGATVSGTGTINLSGGMNTVKIAVKAQNGTTKEYVINVAREGGQGQPGPGSAQVTMSYQTTDAGVLTGVKPSTSSGDFMSAVQVTNGTAKALKADGTDIKGTIGTGDVLRIYASSGTTQKEYKIVIRGDVNGDGIVNVLDLLRIQKHLLGISPLEGAYVQAADADGNGSVNALDLLKTQKDILGVEKLKQ